MPYRPPHMRPKKPTVLTHLLDSWYEPERIVKLKLEKEELEKLRHKINVEENSIRNEISVTMNQWENSRLGRINRRESIILVPSDSYFEPKSAIILYGPFRNVDAEKRMWELLNKYVEKTNKAIGLDVVKIVRYPHSIAMGLEITGGLKGEIWDGVICSIHELEKEIYGTNVNFKLYGTNL